MAPPVYSWFVADDVGGRPFPDGWEPDDDHGAADDEFASVVFDEDFVRAAEIHEPSAVERLLAAAQARAEAEAAGARTGDLYDDGYAEYGPDAGYGAKDLDSDYEVGLYGPYGREGGNLRPYRGRARWHRPVAWMLAVIMGVGMVALVFTAVYRGASQSREDQVPPPATSGVDKPSGGAGTSRPSASAEYTPPAASAVPRTP
jgi:hypothetical protein